MIRKVPYNKRIVRCKVYYKKSVWPKRIETKGGLNHNNYIKIPSVSSSSSLNSIQKSTGFNIIKSRFLTNNNSNNWSNNGNSSISTSHNSTTSKINRHKTASISAVLSGVEEERNLKVGMKGERNKTPVMSKTNEKSDNVQDKKGS